MKIRQPKHWKYIVAWIFILLSAMSSKAVVTISPAYIELTLDKGRPAGQFIISNTGEQQERYRINAAHFIFEENGSLKMIPPDEKSLAPWIKFNPKELSLPPKSKMKVRFTVLPKQKLEAREYWAAMELESLKTNKSMSKDAKGREMLLEIIPAVVVPIFASNGKVDYGCRINQVKLNNDPSNPVLETHLSNIGAGHLKISGSFSILDSSGKLIAEGQIGGDYILPGASRTFIRAINAKIEQGKEYLLRVKYTAPQLDEPVINEIRNRL